jgi:cytochrome c biogenesis protein CcmG, thiol:disulfide interchange protein DsbE
MEQGSMITRVAAYALAALSTLASASFAEPLTAGDAAPACTAPSLGGAGRVSLAEYRGSVVYLDFWASWCGPCRESFPFMNELQRDMAGKGVRIVAISVDKTAADAQRFLTRYPPQFTVALDTSGACPTAFRLEGMPSSFVIDRSGVVRAVHVGFHGKDRDEIRRQLLDALEK